MMQYADESFDTKVISFDLTDKTWITIPSDHHAFQLLLSYIVSHLVDRKGGYLIEILPATDTEEEEQNLLQNLFYDRVKPKIGYGQYTFTDLQQNMIYALYQHIGQPVGTDCGVKVLENLVLFTSLTIESLCKFISDMITISEMPEKGKFSCYAWNIKHQYWHEEVRMDARPIQSVVLPSTTKQRLVNDMTKFLAPKTKAFYLRNGIPYRRSYLFYGVPGTGKTSMIQALAGHFQRNVCFLLPTHPDMTDDSLREAIHRIPSNSIVVFEDIDALFDAQRQSKVKESSLTFSGLLNALDGIISTHGQIFILTTNLRDHLDAALIRNGRVDLHFEFNYAIPEQMEVMWNNFYPPHQGKEEEEEEENKRDYAKEFSRQLTKDLEEKHLSITTSALQHFFINQMNSTEEEALAAIPTIVEEMMMNSSKSMLRAATVITSAEEEVKEGEKGVKDNIGLPNEKGAVAVAVVATKEHE